MIKTKEFFEKRLNAPLVNQGWSWGSYDKANYRIFLRIHEENIQPDAIQPKRALLFDPSWADSTSPGAPERLTHIQALRDGAVGYGVVYSTFFAGDRWKTKDFDHRFLLKLGKVKAVGDQIFAAVLAKLPVNQIVEVSLDNAEGTDIGEIIKTSASVTDRQALVMARIGQGLFRERVLKHWGYRCAVTGCAIQQAIRASHIKPWSESTNEERLDAFNGLPLLATLDALFDRHLISFDGMGKMLISSELTKAERQLVLPKERRLRQLPHAKTAKLLKEHAKLLR